MTKERAFSPCIGSVNPSPSGSAEHRLCIGAVRSQEQMLLATLGGNKGRFRMAYLILGGENDII